MYSTLASPSSCGRRNRVVGELGEEGKRRQRGALGFPSPKSPRLVSNLGWVSAGCSSNLLHYNYCTCSHPLAPADPVSPLQLPCRAPPSLNWRKSSYSSVLVASLEPLQVDQVVKVDLDSVRRSAELVESFCWLDWVSPSTMPCSTVSSMYG